VLCYSSIQLVFRAGHQLVCHNFRSFLFSANLSFIASKHSMVLGQFYIGVAFQVACIA